MYTREEKLQALKDGGVDNWSGYESALEALPEDFTDEQLLQALEDYGVDNWECYDEAMNGLVE